MNDTNISKFYVCATTTPDPVHSGRRAKSATSFVQRIYSHRYTLTFSFIIKKWNMRKIDVSSANHISTSLRWNAGGEKMVFFCLLLKLKSTRNNASWIFPWELEKFPTNWFECRSHNKWRTRTMKKKLRIQDYYLRNLVTRCKNRYFSFLRCSILAICR